MYNTARFMKYYNKPIVFAQKLHIEKYILKLIDKNLEENTIRQIIASLNFTFQKVLYKDIVSLEKIPRPKRKKLLPKVLTKEELNLLFENIQNKKHKLMISLLYSSGLRVSEVINLKREDLSPNNNTVHITGKR